MINVTYCPAFMTILLRGIPGLWKDRHRLLLTWLIVMQALFPGRRLGRVAQVGTGRDHRVALSTCAQCGLLGCPSAGGVVGTTCVGVLATSW